MPSNKELARAWELSMIEKAHQFTAYMFLGQGKKEKRFADTLEEARKHRANIQRQYANDPYRRPVIIYAIVKPYDVTIFVE